MIKNRYEIGVILAAGILLASFDQAGANPQEMAKADASANAEPVAPSAAVDGPAEVSPQATGEGEESADAAQVAPSAAVDEPSEATPQPTVEVVEHADTAMAAPTATAVGPSEAAPQETEEVESTGTASPAQPTTVQPRWMSYQEMREMMEHQGVPLPEPPSLVPSVRAQKDTPAQGPATAETSTAQDIQAQAPQDPSPASISPWQRYMEIVEGMAPEEREACMFFARWMYTPTVHPGIQRGGPYGSAPGGPPGYGTYPGYGYGPGVPYGYPYPDDRKAPQ